jgi:hypothetical protein
MKSPFAPLRTVLCAALFTFIALAFVIADARAQETVVLKDGRAIQCDRVERQGSTLVLWNRRRVAIVTDRHGNEVVGFAGRREDQIGTYTADQLSDATIMRYLPDVWQQMDAQRQAGIRGGVPMQPNQPNPYGSTALGGGPRIQHSLPNPNQRPSPPQAGGAPPALVIQPVVNPPAAPPVVPVFNGVRDAGNNVFIDALMVSQSSGRRVFEGKLTNIAPLRVFDVRVILHTSDMQVMELHDAATQLEGDSRGSVKFSIPITDETDLLRDTLLVIRCFSQPPAQEMRKATYYTFKIERLSTGQWAAVPVN